MAKPDDELVPAFETAIGLPTKDGKPILVPASELAAMNDEFKQQPEIQKHQMHAASVASLFAARAIRPDEVAGMRRAMFDTVTKGLKEVDKVIAGDKQWTPTQARLFSILVERVMPKLSSITIEDPNAKTKLEDLSLEELEAIALGKKKAGAVDAVMKQAEVHDEQADKHERRETKREVLRELAHVTAIDDAEKAYIAKQVAKPLKAIQAEAENPKTQPKFNREQIENVRKARQISYVERLMAKGHTREEAEELERQRIEKMRQTKAYLKEAKARRLGLTAALGDAQRLAKDIESNRRKTLREFRVHPAKGVRKAATVQRELEKAQKDTAEAKERAENPNLRVGTELGYDTRHVGLRQLREDHPELFEGETPAEAAARMKRERGE